MRIAHIPCKIASQRLALKNILVVNDRPAFVWPALAAIESGMFDKVVVSSELPSLIHQFRHRLPELASIEIINQQPSSVIQTTRDVVAQYEVAHATVAVIMATGILLTPDDICTVVKLSEEQDRPVMAVARTHPPTWTLWTDNNGRLHELSAWQKWLLKMGTPRAARWRVDAGLLQVFPPGQFVKAKSLYPKGLLEYQVSVTKFADVDFDDQFELAKVLFDSKRMAMFASS